MKKVDRTIQERMKRYRENQKKKNIRKISMNVHADDVLKVKMYIAQLRKDRTRQKEFVSEVDRIDSYQGRCETCGSTTSHYNCNVDLISKRPEASPHDWWAACDNPECKNHYGEGLLQSNPDWESMECKRI